MLSFIDSLYPHGVFLFFIVLYLVLEYFSPLKKDQSLLFHNYQENAQWYFINVLFLPVAFAGLRKYAILYLGQEFWGSLTDFPKFQIENVFLFGLFIWLFKDFCEYVAHYTSHRFKFLWSFHMVHHSLPQFNPLASFRYHWFEGIYYDLAGTLPFLFFHVGDEGLVLLMLWDLNQQLICHSNFRYSLGFMNGWIGNNIAHGWHHSINLVHPYGQNFGHATLLWDRIFGTYHPAKEFPTVIGIPNPEFTQGNVLKKFVYPFTNKKGMK